MNIGGKHNLILLPSRDIEYHQPQQRVPWMLTPVVPMPLPNSEGDRHQQEG